MEKTSLAGDGGAKMMSKFNLHVEKIKEVFELPQQFCNTCTLKEGTIIVVASLQVVTIMFIAAIMTLLFVYPDETDDWWKEKWSADFDPYLNGEYKELINTVYPLWIPFSYLLIGFEGTYFITGFGVAYAIWKKDVHPGWYLPWICMSGILVTANFLTVLAMVIVTFLISTFRDITVTWDMVPTICTFVYACLWAYGFIVVVSHYKRRVIVKWWKDYNEKQNTH